MMDRADQRNADDSLLCSEEPKETAVRSHLAADLRWINQESGP